MSRTSGKLFLILGPSGVGKGTIIRLIKQHSPQKFVFPLSATTRPPRPQEIPGDTYYFLSPEEFQRKLERDEFLEWAIVHEEHYYGTLKRPIFDALSRGVSVIRELDVQGFESVRKMLPAEQIVSIFLVPPSLEVLEQRIKQRSPLSEEEVAERMESAKTEIRKSKECNYRLLAEDGKIQETFEDVMMVIQKELSEEE